MTTTEVSNGLVLPYAFILVAGKGGAACILLITFMAVTSTLSAQVIAVSSIISFDMYRTYFNRRATDGDVIRWSHYGVLLFSLFAAAFSTMLHYVGIDLGWTLYMLGVITCPGIFPTALTILWRKQSRPAAIVAPVLGMATGIAVWLGTAHAFFGEVSIASTGATLPCMYGTVAATLSPLPYTLVITLLKPENYDWADFRKERLAFDVDASGRDAELERGIERGDVGGEQGRKLKRWGKIAAIWAAATFLGHWVLWPLPMYAAKYIFSKGVSGLFLTPFSPLFSTSWNERTANGDGESVLRGVARHCHHLAVGDAVHCRILPAHRRPRPNSGSVERRPRRQEIPGQ